MGHRTRAQGKPAFARQGLAWVISGVLLGCSLGAPGVGRAAEAQDSASRELNFDIPAGPLEGALARFGHSANILLSYPSRLTSGLNSPGLHGRYGVDAGLERLLAGSGLQASRQGNGSYTLVPAPQASLALPDATILGHEESAWGPVNGWVASRSASATKSDASLLEVPQSVSVIGARQIRDQGAQSLGAALRYTPGVVPEQYGSDLRLDRYLTRGFQDSMPYLDGLWTGSRYTLLSQSVEPYGLDRVEVLRGPSSVLYGQNVPGGLVSLISKTPTDAPLHEINLQGGNDDFKQLSMDLSDTLNDDGSLRYRLVGLARDADTQVDEVDDKRYYLAPSLSWRPDEDTSLVLLGSFQKQDSGMLSQSLPESASLHKGPFGRLSTSFFTGEDSLNHYQRQDWSVGYRFEHRLDDTWTFRQNLRYSKTDLDLGYVAASGFVDDSSQLSRFSLAADAWQRNFAVDNQAEARFATGELQHTATLGVDYFRSHDKWTEQDGGAEPLDVLHPVYGLPIDLPAPDFVTDDKISSVGAYAQDQVRWNHWGVTGSLRQDWARSETRDVLADSRVDQHDQKTSGRLGVTYLFDNGLAPYASYSTSFQPTIGIDAETGRAFKPTTGKQSEVGVKFQPQGQESYAMLSLYDLTQENVVTSDPLLPSRSVQTGEVRVRGLELSGVADLGDGLKAVAAYTLMNAKVTKDTSFKDNKPKDVPRHMANLWLDKTLQSGPLKGFGAGAGVRYLGSRYGDQANDIRLPANTLVDAALHYRYDEHWRAALNATNLFDDTYVATCDNDTFCFYGPRRTLIGSLTYNW